MSSIDDIQLVPVTVQELLALETDPPGDLFLDRGLVNPYGILTGESIPHQRRIDDVRSNPTHIRWYYRLIVVGKTIVGSSSFHAPPDVDGMLEIGLGIAANVRGRGYATAAVIGMWDWAAEQEGVRTLRYTVSPDNAASQAIIAKFPASHMGVQIDERDGPEDIYEIPAQVWRDFRAGERFGRGPQ